MKILIVLLGIGFFSSSAFATKSCTVSTNGGHYCVGCGGYGMVRCDAKGVSCGSKAGSSCSVNSTYNPNGPSSPVKVEVQNQL